MKQLREFELFLRAAESGSLSAAARQLDLTPAAASAAIKRIEGELGTPVFIRSTRSLRLTSAGELFLHHCREGLASIATACDEIRTANQTVGGPLQLSLPSDFGRNVVLGWLDDFLLEHPGVSLRIELSDRIADVFRQPVDLALRYGAPPDSSLIALPVAVHNRRVLCAAPLTSPATAPPTIRARWANTIACASAWATRCMTVGASKPAPGCSASRCTAIACPRTARRFAAGRWPVTASPTNRGSTSPRIWRPGDSSSSARTPSARARRCT